jgi:hypothetical protein
MKKVVGTLKELKELRKTAELFNAVAEYFNAHNVMTDNDFNDICDEVEK